MLAVRDVMPALGVAPEVFCPAHHVVVGRRRLDPPRLHWHVFPHQAPHRNRDAVVPLRFPPAAPHTH
eukprot:2832660-Rhodomonas_salina.1